MTNRFPDCSNSEEGTWSLSRQKSSHLRNRIFMQIGALKKKLVESCFLELEIRFKSLRRHSPKIFDLFVKTGPSRIIEQLLQLHRCEPEPVEGRELDSRLRDRSPSPSGSWSLPSLESVGITSEEWVTRGWNVFFGAWG